MQSQERSYINYRKALVVWISGRAQIADCAQDKARATSVAVECHLLFKDFQGDRLLNSDLNEFFATLRIAAGEIPNPLLVVGGLYLEDQVSRFCLQAVAEGFDTHILCDAIVAQDKSMYHTHIARLTQVGVVPTSFNQFISFLIADTTDERMARALKMLLKKNFA